MTTIEYEDLSTFPTTQKTHYIGKKFHFLTVLSEGYSSFSTRTGGDVRLRAVLARCDCGSLFVAKKWRIKWDQIASCGCMDRNGKPKVRHGLSKHPMFQHWMRIHRRCSKAAKEHDRKNYYDRGIQVCERWKTFQYFLDDMGERPSLRHQIDRIDNERGYEPGNCRWVLPVEQQNNRRNSSRIEFRGETKSVTEWARQLGLGPKTIHYRLKHGWSIENALMAPPSRVNRGFAK